MLAATSSVDHSTTSPEDSEESPLQIPTENEPWSVDFIVLHVIVGLLHRAHSEVHVFRHSEVHVLGFLFTFCFFSFLFYIAKFLRPGLSLVFFFKIDNQKK